MSFDCEGLGECCGAATRFLLSGDDDELVPVCERCIAHAHRHSRHDVHTCAIERKYVVEALEQTLRWRHLYDAKKSRRRARAFIEWLRKDAWQNRRVA